MFGINEFGYGGYTLPTVGMKRAEWADYIVTMPTIYEHCLDSGDADDNFADGWSHTLVEGDNELSETHQMASAISIPEGYEVVLYTSLTDGEGDTKELSGPLNVDCFTSFSNMNDAVKKIVVILTPPDCAGENRITNTDNSCGDCDEGYALDEDTNSDTYGECIVVDNTLLYAGIGGVALILVVALLK